MTTILAVIFVLLMPVYVLIQYRMKDRNTILPAVLRVFFLILAVTALPVIWGRLSGPVLIVSAAVLPIGYAMYIASLLVSGAGFHRRSLLFLGLGTLSGPWKRAFVSEQLRNIPASSMEEVLFHGLLQTVLNDWGLPVWACVAAPAVLFVFAHSHQKKAGRQLLDLLVFAVALTVYFQATGDLLNCVLVHIVRNGFIVNESYTYMLSMRKKERKG